MSEKEGQRMCMATPQINMTGKTVTMDKKKAKALKFSAQSSLAISLPAALA